MAVDKTLRDIEHDLAVTHSALGNTRVHLASMIARVNELYEQVLAEKGTENPEKNHARNMHTNAGSLEPAPGRKEKTTPDQSRKTYPHWHVFFENVNGTVAIITDQGASMATLIGISAYRRLTGNTDDRLISTLRRGDKSLYISGGDLKLSIDRCDDAGCPYSSWGHPVYACKQCLGEDSENCQSCYGRGRDNRGPEKRVTDELVRS